MDLPTIFAGCSLLGHFVLPIVKWRVLQC